MKPGDHKQVLGVLKGFEIVKYPSYVDVRKVWDQEDLDTKSAFQSAAEAADAATAASKATAKKVRKSTDQKIIEAKAECNRTAPTYA